MKIQGKLVLVTGGSRGLGKAIALAFAESGCNVMINYLRRKEDANTVVKHISQKGVKSESFQADISIKAEVQKMHEQINKHYGDVDILINNAGVILRPGDWNLISDEDMNKTIDINLKGAIYCIQIFSPSMVKKGFGRIVNLTTTYAINGAAPVLAYTAAKAGINAVTTAMAKELGAHGVTVNAIAAGNFDTDMTRSAGEGVVNWSISTTPLGRLGKPEEVGTAAVFLAESDFITGHILVVDGGQILSI